MGARWGRAGTRTIDHPARRIVVVFLIGAAAPVVLLAVVAYAIEWA
jgi:hypothetical protein